MDQNRIERQHHNGRGRIFFGMGLTLLAFLWLASKLGWLGAGSTGIAWPVLLIVIGLALVLSGHRGHPDHPGKKHFEHFRRDGDR